MPTHGCATYMLSKKECMRILSMEYFSNQSKPHESSVVLNKKVLSNSSKCKLYSI